MVSIGFVENFQLFLMVLLRMFGMFAIAPFFGSVAIPGRVKALLAFFIAIILFPMVSQLGVKAELSLVPFLMQLAGELFVGIIIGFIVSIFMASFQFAGQIFSFQMGLSITMVFDPQSQIELPIMGQLLSLFSIMIFLSINAHHHLISGVYFSYQSVPALDLVSGSSVLAGGIAEAFTRMFGAAIHIGLPVIATAFLISVVLGILAKTAPQLNVLMLGFPLQIVVGFTILIVSIPFMFRFMENWIRRGLEFANTVIGAL